MKHIIKIMAVLGLFAASPAFAAGLEELAVYPTFQYFTWEEFKDDGSRILKESGPLFGAGAAGRVDLYEKTLMLKFKGELFGGQVDYDGQTQQDPDPTVSELPVKTDAWYFGAKAEADLGWRFLVEKVSIEPFAGLGYRWWLRDIQGSTALDNTPQQNLVQVGGAKEIWQTLYTRFGARVDYLISDDWKVFWEAGAKYPVLNRNTAEVSGSGDVTVRPELEWSAFAEAGFKYKQFRPSFFYEGFRFSRSPSVPIGGGAAVFQPKSESDIFGVSLGWAFR
ncbi:MAG: hypothetical protein FD174_1248 [Geobacteraceae bacterium]|nr:MAG: hypothetical protein FD174_1248 [Geobacteraceae bacterium]